MKKLFAFACFSTALTSANAVTLSNWWQHETICRINTTNCYPNMGAGYDREEWDANGNCRGMKWICPNATLPENRDPILIGRTELARGTGINKDFDTNILNGDCFGSRKTIENGTKASLNGKYVNVWCNGVLDNPLETLPGGEIASVAPSCAELAENGFAGVLNGRCYGKQYDTAKYFIECATPGALMPSRLIILNGADYGPASADTPIDTKSANAKFEQMISVSAAQRAKYMPEK